MSDSDDIQQPSPPAEPVDVSVTPDPPPAEAMDLTSIVLPDPPWEPVDVAVTPDGPPWQPTDVAVDPEPPPAEPFDVPVSPDPPPWEPTDVAVSPEPPPAEPFDVPVAPDAPPADPFDVATGQPSPLQDPIDVPVSPDAPPAEPVDVQTGVPSQPWEPTDVPIVIVEDHRIPRPGEQPVPPIELSPPPYQPTLDGLKERLGLLDRDVSELLSDLTDGRIELTETRVPGGGALDPIILARWLRDYLASVGPGAAARFIAEQTSLFAMNPVVSRVFNPFYFASMLVPGSMGNQPAAIDTLSFTMEDFVQAREVARQPESVVEGIDVPIQPDSQQNPYSELQPSDEGQISSMGRMVRLSMDGSSGAELQRTVEAGVQVNRLDPTGFFTAGRGGPRTVFKRELVQRKPYDAATSRLAGAAGTHGIVPSSFPRELSDGTFETDSDNPSNDPTGLHDDEAYVPLCFTDLRPKANGKFRTVYFRPFGLNFSVAVSPEFEEDIAFGRTDPVVGYTRTVKSYDVSFECHAFTPEDLRSIHQKLFWLQSMAYPSYTADGLLQSGPVLRMRVGDVIASGKKGASGILRSLTFDHADAIWELESGAKVTRDVQVSLSFLALHDGPVGFVDGEFGVLQFPDVVAGPVSVVNGRFQGFGEPKKRT